MFQRNDPKLAAVCLLLKRFGTRIEGGGYEVEVPVSDMMAMSQHGTFQEVPTVDQRSIKWRYFPNDTLDLPESEYKVADATPENAIEKKSES